MTQSEAADRFNLTRNRVGIVCARIIRHRLRNIADTLLSQWESSLLNPENHRLHSKYYNFSTNALNNTTKGEDIADRMRAMVVSVRDERSLLMFLSDKRGTKYGIQDLLRFFCYNFIIIPTSPLNRRMKRLKDSMQTALSGPIKCERARNSTMDEDFATLALY